MQTQNSVGPRGASINSQPLLMSTEFCEGTSSWKCQDDYELITLTEQKGEAEILPD